MISAAWEGFSVSPKFLQESGRLEDLVIQDEQTIVKPYGWILFYCTRQYAETGDFLHMLGGGGPLVVRHNGRTDQLEGRIAAEPTIAEWERKNGLQG